MFGRAAPVACRFVPHAQAFLPQLYHFPKVLLPPFAPTLVISALALITIWKAHSTSVAIN